MKYKTKVMVENNIIIAQKAKKATASIAQFLVVLQCGFYSFLIIGRAVTVHCFFARLDSLSAFLKEKNNELWSV